MTWLLVLAGGAVGAPLRYLADVAVQTRRGSVFPWGTFAVNVTGSLVLGVIAGAVSVHQAPQWVLALLGTGACGALTTFSTFGFETVRLIEDGSWWEAGVNAVASLGAGLVAVALGWALGTAW